MLHRILKWAASQMVVRYALRADLHAELHNYADPQTTHVPVVRALRALWAAARYGEPARRWPGW